MLEATPKAGAIVLRDRLKRQIDGIPIDSLGFAMSGIDILGPATYPEDGHNAEELLASVVRYTVNRGKQDG